MISQGNYYTIGCLLDYPYFKKHKMISIDLSKQKAVDADPKAIQQSSFTGNVNQSGGTTIFFTIGETKEALLNFSQGTVRML